MIEQMKRKLYDAAKDNNIDKMKLLLSKLPKGFNVSEGIKGKATPFIMAVANEHIDIAEMMLPFITDIKMEHSEQINVKELMKLNMEDQPNDATRWNKMLNMLNGTLYGRNR